jgi:NodT family efflux transporter outer membrane factor (OMF) lipoprotein
MQSEPDPTWWASFDDEVLSKLIERAVAGNIGLQEAMLRVVEARQGIASAQAAGLPTLGANASYAREQLGLKGILQSRGVFDNLDSLADRAAGGAGQASADGVRQALDNTTHATNLFQYGFDSSWELDLFGRVRRSVEQARAQTEAQAEATNDALVVLESEVAQTYVKLRDAQALLAGQVESVKAAEESLDLASRRRAQGLNTELDVNQARTQRDQEQSRLPGYQKQARLAVNGLSVLTGQQPGALDDLLIDAKPMPRMTSVVNVGIPSSLARRRPDVREAEARLHAATAGIGVAVADFYPDVSLTGNVGIRATNASYLTRWASLFYSVGPSISIPLFQGGRLSANLRLAKSTEQEAALHYRGTVLNALREVEDGLASYRADQATRDRVADSVAVAATTLTLARDQYANGLAGFIQVLDAQRTLIEQRQDLVNAESQVTNDVIALYRALGGGWEGASASSQASLTSTLHASTGTDGNGSQ